MAARFGRRLRRGATTTAVAAAAIAALSASGAPAVVPSTAAGGQSADTTVPPSSDTAVSGDSPYHTELPPLKTPDKPGTSIGLPEEGTPEAGIPASVLAAYKQAERTLADTKPGCNLPWELLAAIGKVESGQARGGNVDANGTTIAPILGPVLNGVGFADISDTDGGQYDGDAIHDRAIGPMQFIPSTWATWGQDANGDGAKDPNNIYDAALAAGMYLCAGDRDLSVEADLHQSILGYNHSQEYLDTVLSWLEFYRNGTHEVPNGSGVLPTSPGAVNPSPSPRPTPGPGTTPSPKPSGSPSTGGAPSTPKPDDPSKPSKPTKPSDPATPPSQPGGPTSPPPGGDEPGTPAPPAPPVVKQLTKAGGDLLTAVAGALFEDHAVVRAEDADGKPVAGVKVRFQIVGATDARFEGGASVVTVVTGDDGTASAPAVQAGERTGDFTVRATTGAEGVAAVDYAATVTERQADGIVRTSGTPLTAAPGARFAQRVEVQATFRGAIAPDVAVTASMVTSATDTTVPGKGPYFTDLFGNRTRSLTGLTTDANGVLRLPKIFADDATGTFLLRLETAGGATLTVELTVEAPAPQQ
ncbi:lytic transglycosylase [Streptomyces sp. NPDC088725]|uniref:lytic transglycosylase domain-containing protein n=1 Tax=Streptomyces sp. NPDC088725 TaxID=3365873 RepID=UPI00381C34E8